MRYNETLFFPALGSNFLLNTHIQVKLENFTSRLTQASNIYSCFTDCRRTLSVGFLFVSLFVFWWLKQPSNHILSPRLKWPECSVDTTCRHIHFHSAWDMLSHLSVSFYHLDQALRSEFMVSDKRCRENSRQPVCEAAVCDSFPHFIHMLWLIRFLGCWLPGFDFWRVQKSTL